MYLDNKNKNENLTDVLISMPLIVSALGFFVDVFDLLLFAIVRKPSLRDMGLTESDLISNGESLISLQMYGMLIGGVLFGIIGDKYGRLKVLFGSILIYSLANIANAYVANVTQYSILRFIAGIGLAGELGAGLTLVSEQLVKEKRSISTGLIAGFGVFGAVFAYFMSKIFDWRTCYLIGGGMGLVLLLLRVSVKESTLYNQVHTSPIEKGNFLKFFSNRDLFLRYIKCILIGLPTWLVIGILVTFSDQFGLSLGVPNVDPGKAIMYLYIFVGLGDITVGWLCEKLRSRKKTLFLFYGLTIIFLLFYFSPKSDLDLFYLSVMCLGFGLGFNVIYMTLGVEQFGTNLRASAAVSIPNMVRGSLPFMILLFQYTRHSVKDFLLGGIITTIIVFCISITAAYFIKESYGQDLDFLEE